jgi:(p)ppGpp synthase/HD superfamily hydrolase
MPCALCPYNSLSVSGARTSNSQASVEIVLDISDLKHLEQILAGLRKIPGVHEVQRLQKI